MAATLLVIEDERDLAGIVVDYATAAGYVARSIADGRDALEAIRRSVPDLIVLDLMLPGMDGIALCREVRTFSDVPIIMVTARVEEIDRLLGLEVGADDYVCKPFSPRELMARVGVILRRAARAASPEPAAAAIEIDDAARLVRIRGKTLDLTPTEYALLATMARRPGSVWSRAALLDLVRADSFAINDRAIDSHVKNLRRKIAALLPGVEVVESVYGVGYRVELPPA